MFRIAGISIVMILCAGLRAYGDDAEEATAKPDPAAIAYFETHVRPVLADNCYECHSEDNSESNLRVDSLSGMLRGGLRGPAIIPGKPEQSLVIRAMRHGVVIQMPPKRKLSRQIIARVAEWIKQGAVWPKEDVAAREQAESDGSATISDKDRQFWAFQPPLRSHPPQVRHRDWVRTPIDAFIAARLEQDGLSPAPPAARATLLRRMTFALTGLPPTVEQRTAFLEDKSPDAVSRLADRLLASPQYGERWGRHWLDVARYADSNGLDENLAYANAFRYRDYVVDAFNQNLPFDQFVREQIAADLLVGGDAEKLRRMPATGLLSIGPKMLAEDDPVKMRMDIVDEQVDTVGRAFLGLTLGCARCHDHKFDPIPTLDYYSLAGVFYSTTTMDTYTVVARWHENPIATTAQLAEQKTLQAQSKALRDSQQKIRAAAVKRRQDNAIQHFADYLVAAENQRRLKQATAGVKPLGERGANKADVIRWEAEDYARGNVLKDRNHYGNGIGVVINRGQTPNFTEYDVEVSKSGFYQFECRYAAASARPTKLAVNGRWVSETIADGVTGSWTPESQRWEIEGVFELKAGSNVIRLEQPIFFPHIDKLQIYSVAKRAETKLLAAESRVKPESDFVNKLSGFIDAAKEGLLADWKAIADVQPASGSADAESIEAASAVAKRLGLDEDQRQPIAFARYIEQHLADEQNPLRARLIAAEGPLHIADANKSPLADDEQEQFDELEAKAKAIEDRTPQFVSAMAVTDGAPSDLPVHIRGSHLTLGRVAPRGFLRVLATPTDDLPEKQSGRLELANWLTNSRQPLTARVFVNRVWRWHFGAGLVRSTDNFGQLGERPTHPKLLDWLAVEFVESGWDVKHLHRLILESAVWRQSSAASAALRQRDPENRLWARFNRRRLEAESIRDAILASSNRLDYRMRGTLLPTKNRSYVTSTANVDPVVYVTQRRSIYLPVVRSALYDVLQAFDFAEPSALQGDRQTTTVAPQALFMMNSRLMAEQSKRLAATLLRSDHDNAAKVKQLYLRCLARPANADEVERGLQFVSQYESKWKSLDPKQTGGVDAPLAAWRGLCRAVMSSNEFLYLD